MLIKIDYNDQDDWQDDVQNQMMALPDRSSCRHAFTNLDRQNFNK